MESAVTGLSFAPQLPVWAIAALAAIAAMAAAYGLALRADGVLWRSLAALLLLAALLNPQVVHELRQTLDDVALVVVDDSASQILAQRPDQTETALDEISGQLDQLTAEGGFSYRVERLSNLVADGHGTSLMSALERVSSETAANRISGAILLTDGRVHDADSAAPPWPVHVLVSGSERFDRSITLLQAPSFGLVRAGVEIEYVVEDQGGSGAPIAPVDLWVDGRLQRRAEATVGVPAKVMVDLPHAGPVAVELRTEAGADEITDRNNRAIAEISGVRDRLRVLLVSHSPHPAARVWRNLLKTDPAVDLIHFTILRTLDRLSPVPEAELSLIQFPAQRLFIEEIDSFDLLVFDRYRRRQLLSDAYFASIGEYVRTGGALLVALGGPADPTPGLLETLIPEVTPVEPTGVSLEEAFTVKPTERGRRHPLTRAVVADLEGAGSWYWQKAVRVDSGEALLSGARGLPLLTAARVGRGRVGVLASDQAWLWARGHGGGGPHGELFRRMAHWLMGEPELEEERLRLEETDDGLLVTRQTLSASAGEIEVIDPNGMTSPVKLAEIKPGLWQGKLKSNKTGIHRARSGSLEAIGLVGTHDPVEFRDVTSSEEVLRPVAEASGGSVRRMHQGMPKVQRAEGSSDDWIGLPRREVYTVNGIDIAGLFPAWAALALAVAALALAWMAETGRLRMNHARTGRSPATAHSN